MKRQVIEATEDDGDADSRLQRYKAAEDEEEGDNELDMELLDAYIAYCRSVGHEPNIQVDSSAPLFDKVLDSQGSGSLSDAEGITGATIVQGRPTVPEHQHFWTLFIGTRYSKRRGCTQFWVWLLIGVGHVQVTEDYTYLHFLEEVDFHLTYTIETPNPSPNANPNTSYFNALLFNEYEYAHYIDGEPFAYIEAASKLRTTYAYLPRTYIDNTIEETMYFVVQPCYLERNPTADYCNTTQLPTSVSSSEKIYNFDQNKKMKKKAVLEHFNVTYLSVNPMPSFQKNIERIYARELNVPEEEVDYWQPMPWDRKNYFTWVFCPYRNERLSRGERALIVVCSLYVTFYVLFIIVMIRDSYGSNMTIFSSVVLYAVLTWVFVPFYFKLVVLLLTLAQALIFYIWARRSCLFLKKFIYYGVLSAILRMSLMGHCDCFNDELLILAVERVGPKWELIHVLDGLMAKQNNVEAQFEPYTSEQHRERWDVIVERAEKHMEKVEKLRAYQEKKRLEALQSDRPHRSFTELLSRRRTSKREVETDQNLPITSTVDNTDSSSGGGDNSSPETTNMKLCNLREKKILELNDKIKVDAFEKHYDSNISEVFHALTRSVMKLRRHNKHEHPRHDSEADEGQPSEPEDDQNPEDTRTFTNRYTSGSSMNSEGETMWVFDSPEQRLQRREEEKLQRKRAFRVLKERLQHSQRGSVFRAFGPSTFSVVPFRSDTRHVPLLSTRHKDTTPREEDLVILVPDAHSKNKDNLDAMANARVEDDYDDEEDSDFPSDLERGQSRSASSSQAAAAGNRVYAVTERPKTLFRRMSTSASAFAAWALDYDPKAA
ncbi:hypothetical protein PHYSODRAFT_333237 [Phytophthora sojae]|uniref:Uncharacterized protein n=1 Tax=Phytophthora sojae (strain P6497) TaxID=1094619 RepID=G4ZLQ4_PHYSP|nr:hypothetical protein PHYSODRAFT_333237 [Phytophthora sojae]EGZ14947.1 hypothetical protein PHYSODRAFT_333237 [Phytophthora sojae]|eukprot:XP_009528696.1 hypothetical protein PHYSODRAFT_333237 [Phytophthora sojae]